MKSYRVAVCGTAYGQVYLSAFLKRSPEFRLAGIIGRGSGRSRVYAREFGVPFYSSVDELPDNIDIACVVVRSTIAGGEGTFLAKEFLRRGIHVIQEHPVHEGDILSCLKLAEENKAVYHVNGHYVNVDPVTTFIEYLERAREKQRPLFIEATAAPQTLYSLMDIIGRAVGGFLPYAFSDPIVWGEELKEMASCSVLPFKCLQGVIKGIPVTLKIQDYIDPRAFDNHFLIMHRISVGTESGNVTLVNTHGPVVWSQSFSIEERRGSAEAQPSFRRRSTAFFGYDYPTAVSFTGECAPSLCEIAVRKWPEAVIKALLALRRQIETGIAPPGQSREYLSGLSGAWLELTKKAGPALQMDICTAPPSFPDPVMFKSSIFQQPGKSGKAKENGL